MKLTRFVLLSLLVSTISRIASADYGVPELLKTIDDNHVTTIEKLLPLLPMDLRSAFTLVNQSRSLMQGASPESPRAILFGSTGELVLSFNGGQPNQLGGQNIEILSFDKNTSTYQLHEMSFSGSARPTLSETNPQRCTFCHDSHPRPVWSEYRQWDGVTGANDDNIGTNSGSDAVYNAAMAFRTRALKDARYQWLGWSAKDPCFPYHCVSDPMQKSYLNSTNTRFTLLNLLNDGKAIAARAAQTPNFARFKYSLSWGLLCDGNNSAYQNDIKKVMQAIAPFAQIPDGERWIGTFEQWKEEVTKYQAVLELFGIPNGSTSTALRIDDPSDLSTRAIANLLSPYSPLEAGPQPVRGALTVDGLDSSRVYAGLQILRKIAKTDPILQKWLKDNTGWATLSTGQGYHDAAKVYAAPAAFVEYVNSQQGVSNDHSTACNYLKKKSDSEIASSSSKFAAGGLDARPAHWNPGWEILTKSNCIACHDSPGMDAAVKIPFSRPAEFAQFVRSRNAMGVDFIKQVAGMISRGTGHEADSVDDSDAQSWRAQMPYSGAALNPTEQKALLQYLKKMSQAR